MSDIDAWMTEHDYAAWYRDGSDTVYRRGWTGPAEDRSPAPTTFQRMKRWWRGR
jgi:hypothetical protein